MKKFFILIVIVFSFKSTAFADSFYFKKCKISNVVTGEYVINLEKNVIEVKLQATDGRVQNFSDKIKSIEEDKIISQKIKSAKGEKIYYQYSIFIPKLYRQI